MDQRIVTYIVPDTGQPGFFFRRGTLWLRSNDGQEQPAVSQVQLEAQLTATTELARAASLR